MLNPMDHYKSNVHNLKFNLFKILGLKQCLDPELSGGAFGDLDGDTVHQILTEATRLAKRPVAESFADSNRHPPVFDPATHTVTLPNSFKASLQA